MELDNGGHVTIVGLIQEEGAEDIIEKARVVFTGPVAVRIEIHFEDLRLHTWFSWKTYTIIIMAKRDLFVTSTQWHSYVCMHANFTPISTKFQKTQFETLGTSLD